jgi:SRSO17 transposase
MLITDKQPVEVLDPQRWGLPMEIVYDLADRLQGFWERFQPCFKTRTRDTSPYGWVYLRGALLMEGQRNYVNIARRVVGPGEDGQNVQQFMSDSPWSARKVFDQIQAEVCLRSEMSGGMLSLDESGDERAGAQSAGAARQYLGRQGKVDLGQVGVALGYAQAGTWLMVDAELYLPEGWFTEEYADLRRRWHIPPERVFASKVDLGLEMIERARKNKLPFEVVGCDTVYGSSGAFRAALDRQGIVYLAAVTGEVRVYLQRPEVGVPATPEGKKGRPFSRWQVQNGVASVTVKEVAQASEWEWQEVTVRLTERGWLTYPCAARRVWTITEDGQVREEWLFLRKEADGSLSYALSNAPADTPLEKLALWRSLRYFVERTFQDSKSELGWDELVARKYRAWMHHTAIDALALWFVGETKLDWVRDHPRDPELASQMEVVVLPALSVANVRELLRAVMPLKQLSPEQAVDLVVKHLFNRTRATRSRLKAQRRKRGPD